MRIEDVVALKEVLDILKQTRPKLAPVNVWQAYEQLETGNGKSPRHSVP
jgi:hypothetical protein